MKKTVATLAIVAALFTIPTVANAAEDDGDTVTYAQAGPGAITTIDPGYAERVKIASRLLNIGACWDTSVLYQDQPTARCKLF